MHILQIRPITPGEQQLDVIPYNSEHFDAQPLGHDDFVECICHGRNHYPLTIANALPLELEGQPGARPMTVTARMGLPHKPKLFGLVLGGWLPFPFAARKTVLLDRNVVSYLGDLDVEELPEPSKGVEAVSWPYCALNLAGEEVSPLLYVLEGNMRRTPTADEVAAASLQGEQVLRANFKDARVLPLRPEQQAAVLQILAERTAGSEQKQRMLITACPLVSQAVPERNRRRVEDRLLELGHAHGVPAKSFLMIALLSCLYDPHDAPSHKAVRPGRAVLKPSDAYAEAEAYNALADLFFLELLIQFHGIPNNGGYVLYTQDQGLAAFWSALRPRLEQRPAAGSSAIFSLGRSLFPALTDDAAQALAERLELASASSGP